MFAIRRILCYTVGMDRKERIDLLPSALLPWFQKHARDLPWRRDASPYHVWLSEIMLQQTRVEAVKPYYARFLDAIPDIAALAEADPEKLQKLWEGLGYYSRVRNLQAAARQIMTDHGGVFPSDYAGIRALRGIGDYTAGAISSICFEKPTPAVDGNVLRVISRITGDARPVTDEKTKAAVREDLAAVYPAEACGMFTQALMELGATVCLPNGAPDCTGCPCKGFCAAAGGDWQHLPVKTPKKPRRRERLTVFLLYCGEDLALRKRPDTGLLAGLWELPNVPEHMTPEQAIAQAELWGVRPYELEREIRRSHIFTHVEWEMHCFLLRCREMPETFTWAGPDELQTSFALPTAFRMFLEGE